MSNSKKNRNLPKSEVFFFQFVFSKQALPLFIRRPYFTKLFKLVQLTTMYPKHAEWDKRKSLNHSPLTFNGTHMQGWCEGSKLWGCVWRERYCEFNASQSEYVTTLTASEDSWQGERSHVTTCYWGRIFTGTVRSRVHTCLEQYTIVRVNALL